jgi:hypothetical protein
VYFELWPSLTCLLFAESSPTAAATGACSAAPKPLSSLASACGPTAPMLLLLTPCPTAPLLLLTPFPSAPLLPLPLLNHRLWMSLSCCSTLSSADSRLVKADGSCSSGGSLGRAGAGVALCCCRVAGCCCSRCSRRATASSTCDVACSTRASLQDTRQRTHTSAWMSGTNTHTRAA